MALTRKARKLEFLMAEAEAARATVVVTSGAWQSNHCRATAFASRSLGKECVLFLRPPADPLAQPAYTGNLLLDALSGATLHFLPAAREAHGDAIRAAIARLESEGKRVYAIPVGGSNACGLWGYLCAAEELLRQGLDRDYDDIVLAAGTGGTAAGLALGLHLAGARVRVHGVPVCNTAAYFYAHVDEMIEEVWPEHLPRPAARSIVRFIDGYKFGGYEQTDAQLRDFVRSAARRTGVLLDPVYTAKAAYSMCAELASPQGRAGFQGDRVLFLHTGGLFGLMGHRDALKIATDG